MNKKRLEPLQISKLEAQKYFYEVMKKAGYLYENEDIAFSYEFFKVLENVKKELSELFVKINYALTYVYDDSQINVLLESEENKYCFFRHNNKSLDSFTFTFEGIVKHTTEYLAKGEIFSIIDSFEKFANEVLNIPLLSGKKINEDVYESYAILPNKEMIKVCEISYEFPMFHIVRFKLNLAIVIASILANSDERGFVIPSKISSLDVVVIPKNKAKIGSNELCHKIVNELKDFNVIIDESEDSFGYKNAMYDLKGVPFKVIASINEKEEKIVVCSRYKQEKEEVSLSSLKDYLNIKTIKNMKNMLKDNRKFIDQNMDRVSFGKDVDKNIKIVAWCNEDCFKKEDDYVYLVPFHQILSSVPCYFCGKLNKKIIYIFKKSKIF